ncbi:hypothetical protein DMB38_31775 [Streptomyces sp. WAC 06738]|uniref:hypothetical protein n=1 Tax=Streptomyces sp. WAC 06738 TaxID=2203210 RepID=UPI000F6FAA0A|nr:hypothetical protein [Streptomyces sp. WAC 06738]AZM49748.1 hypothetical protein DMB38_31775 [Streptomyces sp. WAC 06738]
MTGDRIALDTGLAPAGTPGGEPVTARRYTHPLLGARPVVRLSGQAAAPGEDRVLAAAGFSAPDAGPPVAAGLRREPGYPAWAVLHDPAHADAALAAAPGMARAERLARPRPGPALDLYGEIATTLPDSHLPAYWEQVGRAFAAAGRQRQAAMMFGRARQADRHLPAIDPARQRAVFLEFALAGALSVKDIKTYVADLRKRPGDPAAAYRELRELAVRRTLGGLPPWPDMLKQLTGLAKAAGLDVAAEHGSLLEDLVEAPALWRASDGFWTSQRKAWLAAVATSEAVRRRLVWQLADLPYSEMDAWWIAFLTEADAFDHLGADTGRWLTAMLRRYRGSDERPPRAPKELLDLLPRLAARIGSDEGPLRLGNGTAAEYRIDAAVIGGCLAAGIPVPDPEQKLLLGHWWEHDRVDLAALTADERFAGPLIRSLLQDKWSDERWQRAWTIEPLRPFLRRIVDDRLDCAASGALQSALDAFDWLYGTLSRKAVAEVPGLLDRLAAVDLVAPLTRTLRAGILDELGWDALDIAAAELKGEDNWCRASWPVLTVHDRRKAVAIGPGGRIAEHRLVVPKGAARFHYDVRALFSQGEFQVFHAVNQEQSVYWSGAPADIHTEHETSWKWRYGEKTRSGYTFLGPGARRFTGHRLLTVGERRVGPEGHMFHDGRTYWWYTGVDKESRVVRPVDPATGELGEPGLPAFLDPSLLGRDEGWLIEHSSLAPVATGTATTPLGTDGTHLGFRVAYDRVTGQVRYHRVDGAHGTALPMTGSLPHGRWSSAPPFPWGLLDVPGSDRRLLLDGGYDVTARDPETGTAHWRVYMMDQDWIVNSPSPMAAGTRRMPPKAFWHFLTARDLPGSRALREISEDTVRALLAATATSAAELRKALGALLPDVRHELLLDGLTGFFQETDRRIQHRDRLLKVLDRQTPRLLEVPEPDLEGALDGLVGYYPEGTGGTVRQIELAAAFLAGSIDGETAMAHWAVHGSHYDWTELAGRIGGLGVRAASAVTPAAYRTAVIALLRFWAASPLTDPALHRGLLDPGEDGDESPPVARSTAEGKLLPLDIAMHFGEWSRTQAGRNYRIKAFLQRGDMPRPEGFAGIRPVARGWSTVKRLRRLADELERREPLPFDSDAAAHLAKAAGLDRAEAALWLTGLPGVDTRGVHTGKSLPPETRAALGLKVTEAAEALDRLWRVPTEARLALYDAAMPDDPGQLWNQHLMAERLAEAYRRQPPG